MVWSKAGYTLEVMELSSANCVINIRDVVFSLRVLTATRQNFLFWVSMDMSLRYSCFVLLFSDVFKEGNPYLQSLNIISW